MTCYFPRDAWRSETVNPETGKRPIEFGARRSIFDESHLQVQCGKCDGCRADRSQEWAIRMYHESSLHSQNCMATLTYAKAPPSIVRKDLQDFFKRLRHKVKFRYFACGEYGGLTNRPHYHVIFFGSDFLSGSYSVSDSLYSHSMLDSMWGHGQVAVMPFSMSSACYVAGYVNKKIGDTDTFSLMSRCPPIGSAWLSRFADDIRRTGCVSIEGKAMPVPRRYVSILENFYDIETAESVGDALKRERLARFAVLSDSEKYELNKMLPARQLAKRSDLSLRSQKL